MAALGFGFGFAMGGEAGQVFRGLLRPGR